MYIKCDLAPNLLSLGLASNSLEVVKVSMGLHSLGKLGRLLIFSACGPSPHRQFSGGCSLVSGLTGNFWPEVSKSHTHLCGA